jgi:hypothetical protein
MNFNNAEKRQEKLLTKNEIIYIISANSTKVRVVFGNNEPKNEKMKVPLVAYGFTLIERDARFHNRLKIVFLRECRFDPDQRYRNRVRSL